MMLFVCFLLESGVTSPVSVLIYGVCAGPLASLVAYRATLDTHADAWSCTGYVFAILAMCGTLLFLCVLFFVEFVLLFQLNCFVMYFCFINEMTSSSGEIQIASHNITLMVS